MAVWRRRWPLRSRFESIMKALVVYTDGSRSLNPGPGGWAWAVDRRRFASGSAPSTTNQRMEIQAAFEAVNALQDRLEVVSDSTYVVNCFRDCWWRRVASPGWTNSQRKPVANRDLWGAVHRAGPRHDATSLFDG